MFVSVCACSCLNQLGDGGGPMSGISLIASGFLHELSVTYTQSVEEDKHSSTRKYYCSYANTHVSLHKASTVVTVNV